MVLVHSGVHGFSKEWGTVAGKLQAEGEKVLQQTEETNHDDFTPSGAVDADDNDPMTAAKAAGEDEDED